MSATTSELAAYFPLANEGAEVRAVANWVRDGGTRQLEGFTPRAHVVVAWDELSLATVEAVTRDVVITDSLPHYVGALDQVTIVGEHPTAPAILAAAEARGCAVTVIAGPESSLVNGRSSQTKVPPHIPFAEDFSVARVAVTVAAVTGSTRDVGAVAEELTVTSELVDEEIAVCHPDRDAVTNPARILARQVRDGVSVHVGPPRLTRLLSEILISRSVPAVSATSGQAEAMRAGDVALNIVEWWGDDPGSQSRQPSRPWATDRDPESHHGPEGYHGPVSSTTDLATTLRYATRVAAATVMGVS